MPSHFVPLNTSLALADSPSLWVHGPSNQFEYQCRGGDRPKGNTPGKAKNQKDALGGSILVAEMRRPLLFCNLFCLGLASLSAQTAILMSAGYGNPAPIQAAPGQVITLYISGTKTVLPSQSPSIRATTIPLPTTLGGFSVTVRQGNNTYAAPLVSVVQTQNCTDPVSSPQCIITALTVQIPFEVGPILTPVPINGDLSVNDNGTDSAHFPIALLFDNIHILTICDKVGNNTGTLPTLCPAIVTHADGTTGSLGDSPVMQGETIVLWAYGLGQTTPVVKTGDATPTPAPVLSDGPNVTIQFDFRPNAGPAMPYLALTGVISPTPITTTGPVVMPIPPFVGLTPGQVGLYQINVKIPDTIPTVPACTQVLSCISSLLKCVVQSNLTIDIGGLTSFDGAAICVQPPQ